MKKPTVSVVIPTFNRRNDLLECVNALSNCSFDDKEVIVVDNASTDSTYDSVKRMFPQVKIIRNEVNRGATGGRNRGAAEAKGDYVLFLDHDVIIDQRMVQRLAKVLGDDPSLGMAGPAIYYHDQPDRIWAAGTAISMLTGRVYFNTNVPDTAQPFDVPVLPSVFMMRRDVLNEVGPFDDIFFATYEDTDFCFRIRKKGYRVVCIPTAKAWHKLPSDPYEQTIAVLRRSYFVARNRMIFMKRHAKPVNFMMFLALFVPAFATYYTWQSQKIGRLDLTKEYWRGLLDGFREILFDHDGGKIYLP